MKDLVIRLRMDRTHAKAAADAQAADNKKVGDAAVDAARRTRQANQESLTAAQVAERAKQQLVRQTNKQQVDAAVDVMKAQKESTESHTVGLMGNLTAVGALVSGYGGLGIASQAVAAIGEMWKAQRRDIEDSVDRIAYYRDAMLELAALKDRLGQSTPELQAQLEFRAKTLQSREAAQVFQGGALNTGQAAMASGVINKGEFDKLMVLSGSYQAATNANPDALGNLTGMLPGVIGKQDQSADDVFRRMTGIFNIIQKGGSSLGSGIGQFANNSGLTQMGMFKSPEEQAALQSYFSLKAPLSAGTRVDQFVRGTAGMTTKARGTGMEGSEKQFEYGARLGVTDAMRPMEIGRLIARDLKSQAATAGPDFNPYNYLAMHGITDQETKMALLDFSQGVNSGTFDKSFGAMAAGEAIPTMAEARAPIDRFQAVDPVAMARKNDLGKDLADSSKASGPEGMYLNLKRAAFNRLRARGETYGEFDEQNGSTVWEGQIIDETRRMLDQAGSKVGVQDITRGSEQVGIPGEDVLSPFGLGTGKGVLGGSASSRLMYSNDSRAKAFSDYATRIQEAGGKIDGMDQLIEISRQTLESQKRMEERAARGATVAANPPLPAPLRAAPPVPTR